MWIDEPIPGANCLNCGKSYFSVGVGVESEYSEAPYCPYCGSDELNPIHINSPPEGDQDGP